MDMIPRRSVLVSLAAFGLSLTASPLQAAPRPYMLDADASKVGFVWKLGPDAIQGEMPIAQAELAIDFTDVRRSDVRVVMDASNARAGFLFATQALRGPKMLDTANHPLISFNSTSVRKSGDGARIDGQITVRGVTRSQQLNARLFRPAGSDPGDLDQLRILLDGTLSRSAFGATS